eukprot:7227587-Pyramimonas_sp.AAC.2
MAKMRRRRRARSGSGSDRPRPTSPSPPRPGARRPLRRRTSCIDSGGASFWRIALGIGGGRRSFIGVRGAVVRERRPSSEWLLLWKRAASTSCQCPVVRNGFRCGR